MRKVAVALGAFVFLAFALGIVACKPEAEPAARVTPTPTPAVGRLSDMLGRAARIASVKYDQVITISEMPTYTQKVWIKGKKIRVERPVLGTWQVLILNRETQRVYRYIPDMNYATGGSGGEIRGHPTQALTFPTEWIEVILASRPVVMGTETVDGKVSLVVEFAGSKAWIWEEYGLVIRMEYVTPNRTTTIQWKDVEFVDIPDSIFELPAGVPIEGMGM